jgi:GNAT superfamily N-acetyltransferase
MAEQKNDYKMKNKNILLRLAYREDVSKLINVFPQITSRAESISGRTLGLDDSLKIFDQILNHGNISIVVAVDQQTEEILGALTLVIVPNFTYEGRPWAILENVVVVREHRSKGIGSMMLNYAFNLAEQARCYKIQVLSGPHENQVSFYKKAGMTEQHSRGLKKYFIQR